MDSTSGGGSRKAASPTAAPTTKKATTTKANAKMNGSRSIGNRDPAASAEFEFDLSQIKDLDRGATLGEKGFVVNLEKLATFERIEAENLKRNPDAVRVQEGSQRKTKFFNDWWKREEQKAATRIQSTCRGWHTRHSADFTPSVTASANADCAARHRDRVGNDNHSTATLEAELTPSSGADDGAAADFLASVGVLSSDGDGSGGSTGGLGKSNAPSVTKAQGLAAVALGFPKLKNMAQSKEFQRMKIAQELVSTEQNYVMQLEHMCSIYETLQTGKRSRTGTQRTDTETPPSVPRVSQQQCRLIFGNVKELLNFNRLFLSDLEAKMEVLYPSSTAPKAVGLAGEGSTSTSDTAESDATAKARRELQQLRDLTAFASASASTSSGDKVGSASTSSSHLLRASLGRVFLDFAAFFKSYSVYSTNYAGAQLMLDQMVKSRNAFRDFLLYEAKHQEGGMSLQNLLIAPVQRIPRYALLLDELLKKTPPSKTDPVQQQYHDDLAKALDMVRRTATYINDMIDRGQALAKVVEIQERFRRGTCDLVQPNRLLLKQGRLHRMSSHGYLIPHEYFLFSDVLLQAVPQRVRGNTRYVEPIFFWVLGVEDDKALSNSEVRSGRESQRLGGSLLQRLMQQLTRPHVADEVAADSNQPAQVPGVDAVEQEDDPGHSAIATAGVLFEEGKLNQTEYDLIRDRVKAAEKMRISDDSLPCSFKVLFGSSSGDFFWLCAPSIPLKEAWVEQLRAAVPKHRQHWERQLKKEKAEARAMARNNKQHSPKMDVHTVAREKLAKGLLSQREFDHIVRIPLPPDATDQAVSAANSRESNEKLQSAKDLLESHAKEHGSQGYLAMRNALTKSLGRKLEHREKMALQSFLQNNFNGGPSSSSSSENTSDRANSMAASTLSDAGPQRSGAESPHIDAASRTSTRPASKSMRERSLQSLLRQKHRDGTISGEELGLMMKVPLGTPGSGVHTSFFDNGTANRDGSLSMSPSSLRQSVMEMRAGVAPMNKIERSTSASGLSRKKPNPFDEGGQEAPNASTEGSIRNDQTGETRASESDQQDDLGPLFSDDSFNDEVDELDDSDQEARRLDARLSGIATAALRQSIRRHSARRDRDSDTRSMALSIVNMTKVLIKEQIMDGAISKNESEHITQVLEKARVDGMLMADELPMMMLQVTQLESPTAAQKRREK